MNRLSSRVKEGRGEEVEKAQKKGGEEGVKPVEKDLMPSRNRRRNLNLYWKSLLPATDFRIQGYVSQFPSKIKVSRKYWLSYY